MPLVAPICPITWRRLGRFGQFASRITGRDRSSMFLQLCFEKMVGDDQRKATSETLIEDLSCDYEVSTPAIPEIRRPYIETGTSFRAGRRFPDQMRLCSQPR